MGSRARLQERTYIPKVLWRFKWQTSPPTRPGEVSPIIAWQGTRVSLRDAREMRRTAHVEVGSVEVDLSSSVVDDLARLLNTALEDAVGARVRDHERGEVVAVLVGLGEIGRAHV